MNVRLDATYGYDLFRPQQLFCYTRNSMHSAVCRCRAAPGYVFDELIP